MQFLQLLSAVTFSLCLFLSPSTPGAMDIVGYREMALLDFDGEAPALIEAKMDTGADGSSIHAEDIEPFERNGADWVRFSLILKEDEHGEVLESRVVEENLVDTVLIKRKGEEPVRRYVVKFGICVDKHYKKTEVNLSDRSGFSTRALVGRSFMRDALLVDSALTKSTEPNCSEVER
jgi:hypothetical protein